MFNPQRLELGRKRRRLSAIMLAEKAGITAVNYSRIVNGRQTPDDSTVEGFAKALAFPSAFFFGHDTDPIDAAAASFRSLKAMTAKERDAAISAGSLAYMVTDWVRKDYNLPSADILDLGQERDPSAAARALRTYWSIGEKPIGNMVKLLESKGVRVFSLAENTRNVDAFSCWRNDEPYVFLNTLKSTERSRFDAAHELGHLVLHRHGGARQGKSAEVEANAFASAFLMPEADFVAVLPYVTRLDDIVKAKRRWGTSAMAVAFRLHKLSRISDWQYRMFCIHINRTYGREEPNGLDPERSSIWKMILTDLWKRGMTRSHIASALHLPFDELENLLCGLIGDTEAPMRVVGRPALKMIS